MGWKVYNRWYVPASYSSNGLSGCMHSNIHKTAWAFLNLRDYPHAMTIASSSASIRWHKNVCTLFWGSAGRIPAWKLNLVWTYQACGGDCIWMAGRMGSSLCTSMKYGVFKWHRNSTASAVKLMEFEPASVKREVLWTMAAPLSHSKTFCILATRIKVLQKYNCTNV